MGAKVSKYDEEVKIFDALEKWNSNNELWSWQKPSIIVSGLVGVGKSTLVNVLSCKDREGRCGENEQVGSFTKKRMDDNLEKVIITDIPGLDVDSKTFQQDIQNTCELYQASSNDLKILVYAIDMTDTRFEENHDDLVVMKALCEANKDLWGRAVIVLTKANMVIADGKDLTKKLEIWKICLRKHLVNVVGLEKEIAESVQILPAGCDTRLEQQPPGLSWVNSIWLAFLKISIGTRYFQKFVYILVEKIFNEPDICGETICEFLTLHRSGYTEKASVYTALSRNKISQVCSFLHVQKYMLENYKAIQHDYFANMQIDEQHKHVVQFWHRIVKDMDILVTGNSESGKTTLMNSLFFGYEKLQEKKDTTVIPQTLVSSTFGTTCHLRETVGLDARNSGDHNFNLALFCVRAFDDRVLTRSNMVKYTEKYSSSVWQKTLIILTEANLIVSAKDYGAKLAREIESINKTLNSITGESLASPVPIIPAGYHKYAYIQADPHEKFWVVDIWMKMILLLPPACKVAFITLINECMLPDYLRHLDKKFLASSYFKYKMIETLDIVLHECKLVD